MKRAALFAVAVVLALGAAPSGADDSIVIGTWDVLAQTPDGPMPAVMTVSKLEGKLKAEMELGGMKRTVTDEALEGDVLKLKVDYDGVRYAIQGKIAKDAIEGTWEGGGNYGTLTAKKRP